MQFQTEIPLEIFFSGEIHRQVKVVNKLCLSVYRTAHAGLKLHENCLKPNTATM